MFHVKRPCSNKSPVPLELALNDMLHLYLEPVNGDRAPSSNGMRNVSATEGRKNGDYPQQTCGHLRLYHTASPFTARTTHLTQNTQTTNRGTLSTYHFARSGAYSCHGAYG